MRCGLVWVTDWVRYGVVRRGRRNRANGCIATRERFCGKYFERNDLVESSKGCWASSVGKCSKKECSSRWEWQTRWALSFPFFWRLSAILNWWKHGSIIRRSWVSTFITRWCSCCACGLGLDSWRCFAVEVDACVRSHTGRLRSIHRLHATALCTHGRRCSNDWSSRSA